METNDNPGTKGISARRLPLTAPLRMILDILAVSAVSLLRFSTVNCDTA